jgi:CO dehydrogenase/acetyl-CoA synthase beta subunit
LRTEKEIEKGISEIVGALADPVIVFPGGWGDTLPDWLKNAITMERLVENMKASKGEQPTGTDAEACAYLSTASLTAPMDGDWSRIYLYVAGKTYARWHKSVIPDDIRVDSLTGEQMADLNRLKEWLYRQRTTARQEMERVERREKKEEEVARRKAEQPALFEF